MACGTTAGMLCCCREPGGDMGLTGHGHKKGDGAGGFWQCLHLIKIILASRAKCRSRA